MQWLSTYLATMLCSWGFPNWMACGPIVCHTSGSLQNVCPLQMNVPSDNPLFCATSRRCLFQPRAWTWCSCPIRLYRKLGFGQLFLPDSGDFIGYWRLRDWLRLLGFEVELGEFGCYRPGVTSHNLLNRFEWMDRAGARWWPIFGAAYFLVAVKRVRGVRLLGPTWKTATASARKSVSVANLTHEQ